MPLGKNENSVRGTPKITSYAIKNFVPSNPLKRTVSAISPEIENPSTKQKSPNDEYSGPVESSVKVINADLEIEGKTDEMIGSAHSSNQISKIMEPILEEFKSLKETLKNTTSKMEQNYNKLENSITIQQRELATDISRLETVITNQKKEIVSEINEKVEVNTIDIQKLVAENEYWRGECDGLKNRLSKIETSQLSNNVIVTGIPEQTWEPYECTKQRVYDTISSAIIASDPSKENSALEEARSMDIAYCTRVGKYRPNHNRPISVTFTRRDDKERVMLIKNKLPMGIYINNEYPLHVKKIRDTVRPILRLAKNNPRYKEKSKLEGDHLVINGTRYGISDLNKLPSDLASYKAVQKEDNSHIAFHGELSPYSNFHRSNFVLLEHQFHSTEQWIQYQKALLFGDSFTANQILATSTPYELKRLGYNVNGFDIGKWKNEGYDLCLEGIKAKFIQNPPLLNMLKSTEPKVIVESSLDKLWGTGVQLRDQHALNPEKWHGTGWMSAMSSTVRNIDINK